MDFAEGGHGVGDWTDVDTLRRKRRIGVARESDSLGLESVAELRERATAWGLRVWRSAERRMAGRPLEGSATVILNMFMVASRDFWYRTLWVGREALHDHSIGFIGESLSNFEVR